ncbi:SDR family oxidoreductase [Streptomyces sp. NPDC126499]|uniref:SDR family oxidoreductase n=1 Tax=Streptomyces sp. NPDC126499 TaxID=3155314 RepID=UPI00331D768F
MTGFDGRTYIVTGGGSGIGRAIALALAGAGARVAVAGRDRGRLDGTVALAAEAEAARTGEDRSGGAGGARVGSGGCGEVFAVPTDVRDPEAVDALVAATVERFGGVDGLVNNAAGNFVVPGIDLSPGGWRAVVDIVLNGSYYCTRAVARRLREQGTGGSILSVIATYAWHGHPGTVHSAAAKAGVLAMTRTLAVELAPLGIRLNCVAPGPTETAGAGAALWATPEARAEVLATVPAGRFATPAEIAEASLFLLGDGASYLTGECLTVDGGQWLGKQVYGRAAGQAVPMP